MPSSTDRLLEYLKQWGIRNEFQATSLSVSKFSTGMRRRLALARMSLIAAPFWVLDEPFYGLDDEGIKVFVGGVKNHLERGGSVVLVSHDIAPLAEIISKTIDLQTFVVRS